MSTKPSKRFLLVATVALIGFAVAANEFQIRSAVPIIFESRESKTIDGLSVYNRIQYFPGENKDVWMMQQSHHGLAGAPFTWDRLQITVDKTTMPYTASFSQLSPGALVLTQNQTTIAYRVSCFICHANGPRVIRPAPSSQTVTLNLIDRIRVQVWNLRIKTYPRIVGQPAKDWRSGPALRFSGNYWNEKLPTPTCMHCHHDEGRVTRGFLTRQNAGTIRFLINENEMPPFPFRIKAQDKAEINAFLDGL